MRSSGSAAKARGAIQISRKLAAAAAKEMRVVATIARPYPKD